MVLAMLSMFLLCAGCSGEKGSITVFSTGTVSLEADTAKITLAVQTIDAQAVIASAENAKIMTAVNNELAKIGINPEDIASTNYSVYQESYYNSDTKKSEYGNYRVSNNIVVTVHDVEKTGEVIDTALAAGVNNLSSVNFYARDTTVAYSEARKRAVLESVESATILATTAGKDLGDVIKIEEGGNYGAVAQEVYVMRTASNDYTTPMSPGTTDVSVSVSAEFALQ